MKTKIEIQHALNELIMDPDGFALSNEGQDPEIWHGIISSAVPKVTSVPEVEDEKVTSVPEVEDEDEIQIFTDELPGIIKRAPLNIRKDNALMDLALTKNEDVFFSASSRIRKDPTRVLRLIKSLLIKPRDDEGVNPWMLETRYWERLSQLPKSVRRKPAIFLAIVEVVGSLLKYAHRHIKNNKKVGLASVKNNPSAYNFVSPRLAQDPDIIREVIKTYPQALQHLPKNLQLNNIDIVQMAVKLNGLMLSHANKILQDDLEIVLFAVRQNGNAICYASERLQKDPRVILAARQTSKINDLPKNTELSLISYGQDAVNGLLQKSFENTFGREPGYNRAINRTLPDMLNYYISSYLDLNTKIHTTSLNYAAEETAKKLPLLTNRELNYYATIKMIDLLQQGYINLFKDYSNQDYRKDGFPSSLHNLIINFLGFNAMIAFSDYYSANEKTAKKAEVINTAMQLAEEDDKQFPSPNRNRWFYTPNQLHQSENPENPENSKNNSANNSENNSKNNSANNSENSKESNSKTL